MKPASAIDEARVLAEAELPMWPGGCYLRHSPALSTADAVVFVVLSNAGRECGTVAITPGGDVVTRSPPLHEDRVR